MCVCGKYLKLSSFLCVFIFFIFLVFVQCLWCSRTSVNVLGFLWPWRSVYGKPFSLRIWNWHEMCQKFVFFHLLKFCLVLLVFLHESDVLVKDVPAVLECFLSWSNSLVKIFWLHLVCYNCCNKAETLIVVCFLLSLKFPQNFLWQILEQKLEKKNIFLRINVKRRWNN